MGLCLLWQPAILLYIIVMYYVVLVWWNKFSSSFISLCTRLKTVELHMRWHMPTPTAALTVQDRTQTTHSNNNTWFSCGQTTNGWA